ncbi:hypothetical protein AB0876_03765 [Mycobacterium sp. NPDC049093]
MSDVQTVLDRIDALVSRYYHHADEETRAVITNLTGIHRLMADLIVAQAVERDHWATEARNAVEARDEADEECAVAEEQASDALADNHVLALEIAEMGRELSRLRAIEQEYEAHRCEGAS